MWIFKLAPLKKCGIVLKYRRNYDGAHISLFVYMPHTSKWYFVCRCVKWNKKWNCTLHAVGCVPPKMVNKWLVGMLHIHKMSLRYVRFRILLFVGFGLIRSRWMIRVYNSIFILKYLSLFNFARLYIFKKKVIQFLNQILLMLTHIDIFKMCYFWIMMEKV